MIKTWLGFVPRLRIKGQARGRAGLYIRTSAIQLRCVYKRPTLTRNNISHFFTCDLTGVFRSFVRSLFTCPFSYFVGTSFRSSVKGESQFIVLLIASHSDSQYVKERLRVSPGRFELPSRDFVIPKNIFLPIYISYD